VYGVPENLLKKVQSVQNAAACLLTSACRFDHRQMEFKITCLVHQTLASLAPTYLIILVSMYGCHLLHSSIEMSLWYLLRRDSKKDQSRAEWVCFQRFSSKNMDSRSKPWVGWRLMFGEFQNHRSTFVSLTPGRKSNELYGNY